MSEANDLYLDNCNDDYMSDNYYSEKCTGERWNKFSADLVFYGVIAAIVSQVLSVLLYAYCICQYKITRSAAYLFALMSPCPWVLFGCIFPPIAACCYMNNCVLTLPSSAQHLNKDYEEELARKIQGTWNITILDRPQCCGMGMDQMDGAVLCTNRFVYYPTANITGNMMVLSGGAKGRGRKREENLVYHEHMKFSRDVESGDLYITNGGLKVSNFYPEQGFFEAEYPNTGIKYKFQRDASFYAMQQVHAQQPMARITGPVYAAPYNMDPSCPPPSYEDCK